MTDDEAVNTIPTVDPGPLYTEDYHQLVEEVPGEDVSDAQLRADAWNPEGWLHYNKGLENHGFSPASRIRPETIDSLSEVYDLPFTSTIYQHNPIVVPGDPPVVYLALGDMTVQARNARTGDTYWTFGYSPEDTTGVSGKTRGVAVRGGSMYLAAADLRLVALDRYTGEFQWKTHLLSERQENSMIRPERMGQSQGPIAYDGTVMVGQSGGRGEWGAVLGIDAGSGDRKWAHDVCRPENWVGESWRYGDGASWVNPTIDPVTGLVFHATGNPSAKFNGTVRPGPNRDTDSVVAIDVDTGEHVWSYQLLAQDWFDWDATTPPRVFDLRVDGEDRRVLAVEDKTGWTHVVDAETGQLIERTEAYAKQGGDAEEDLEFLTIHGRGGPEGAKFLWPAPAGGTNWSPDAFSPRTGMLYVGGNDMGLRSWWSPEYEYDPQEIDRNNGGSVWEWHDEHQCRLAAIDPADGGRVKWTHEFGSPDGNRVQTGGTTATAGGILFTGSPKKELVAFDDESGEKLWSDDLGSTVESSPVVWDDPVKERQYVAVTYDYNAEGSGTGIGRLRVYASEPGIEPLETPTPTRTTAGDDSTDAGSGSTSTPSAPGFGVGSAVAGAGLEAIRRARDSADDEE